MEKNKNKNMDKTLHDVQNSRRKLINTAFNTFVGILENRKIF
ncbi:putative uncharacterized protein [Parachlamydia acanthamoebae UV-7]|jgi:hypothetical protein|uniref:Uncharacterized protein n=1 Tax=Parachlamydia acanthamoebae (strain UV7) TaxID=765952 RepID=F8L008_PARAV|nr:hypothetical protein pah_c188o017 [Parachlamydia acanthamoebae str. Hall's coccus]CCB86520.1 putative uncharacterized protein [Parachlamydia acanthamoebae UV-7]